MTATIFSFDQFDEPPLKKALKRKAASSRSEEEAAAGSGSDSEEKPLSDGGGSDCEPDEPVRVGRGESKSPQDSAIGVDGLQPV